MPKYRVQLKQGSRTIVEHIEAKSVASCLAFYKDLTTMKVTEILKIEYQDDTKQPIDDFNYFSIYKSFIKTQTGLTRQVVLHNIKLSKNEHDIAQACIQHLEIENMNVDSIYCSLFKR